MTALVKGSVARGCAPMPPEAYIIKYARGSAVHRIEPLLVEVSLVISPN